MEKCYFKVPDAESRRIALGSLPGTPFKTRKGIQAMINYFEPIPKPDRSDWLFEHEEEGQSFDAYKGQMHNEVTKDRNIICIVPLDAEIPDVFLSQLGDYCKAFFLGATIEMGKPVGLERCGIESRINPGTQKIQYHAGKILQFLQKKIRNNIFCIIGVTMCDLYPRDEWNFVFGLASLKKRTGVFSIARYDEDFFTKSHYVPDYKKIYYRAVKVMIHEISHMFGIRHCIFYNCLMNGSNHMEQSQKKPMELCPICLRKLQSNLGFDILERYRQLLQCIDEEEHSPIVVACKNMLKEVVAKLDNDFKKK